MKLNLQQKKKLHKVKKVIHRTLVNVRNLKHILHYIFFYIGKKKKKQLKGIKI